MSNQDTNGQQTAFRPSLSLLDATMIVAGSMIGSGVFLVSAEITRSVGSAGWLTLMWILGGIVTIIAAVSYGELSGMYPRAGGQYVYLREAYNPFIAFLFGWTQFGVIQAGTIAAVAVAFAKYSAFIIPVFSEDNILLNAGFFSVSAAQILAIISIVVLTWINTRGIRNGKIIQTVFTLAKLVSLFGLIIFGFLLGAKQEVWSANWAHAWDAMSLAKGPDGQVVTTMLSGLALFGAVAISMKGSLFSSDAWNNITFIAAEIKNPQRNIGRALFLGTLLVTIVYVSANLMYIAVLPLQEIAFVHKDRVAVAAAEHIFGNGGAKVIAVMIMISTFGCNNGLTLAGARIYYTMAQDKLFFKKAGELNKFDVPANGLWIQCLWASLLCLTGKYGDLLTMVIFGVLIFYVITILGIFILRQKRPDVPRPYKAFGYPVLPLLYIIVAVSLALLLLVFEFNYAVSGLGIILLGIPVYYLALSRRNS